MSVRINQSAPPELLSTVKCVAIKCTVIIASENIIIRKNQNVKTKLALL